MTTVAEPVRADNSLWRPMLAAMSKTGSASIASGLLSALATKIVASLLGPSSIALLQTLQQLRDGGLIAATGNGRTASTQGASALHGIERREYVRTVAFLFASGTLLVVLAVFLAPDEIVRWSRLPMSSKPMLPWLGGTIALLSTFIFLSAILNALREIGKLALLQLASPLVAVIMAWPLATVVRIGNPNAIIFLLLIPSAAAVAAAASALQDHFAQLQSWFRGPGHWWTSGSARYFFSISGAMLTSGLVASVALLAVRGSITHRKGLATTGQFDAAWNISMNHVTLILGSVQTYYLPSLSASVSAIERERQIRTMLVLAILATVPAIVTLVVLKPLVIGILYSPAFAASSGFLRWTLLGDYLKVSSWVLATPMLATRDVWAFLTFDLLTHATFLGSAMFLGRLIDPAESAAIGFLLSYAAYFVICYMYARIRNGFQFDTASSSAWIIGLMLIVGASASAWADTTVHYASAVLWIALSMGFSAAFAVYMSRREA